MKKLIKIVLLNKCALDSALFTVNFAKAQELSKPNDSEVSGQEKIFDLDQGSENEDQDVASSSIIYDNQQQEGLVEVDTGEQVIIIEKTRVISDQAFSMIDGLVIFACIVGTIACLGLCFLLCCRFLGSKLKKKVRRTYITHEPI